MPRGAHGFTLFCFLLILLLPLTARAQSQSTGGEIDGTVTADNGGALPGITVTIRNQETGSTRETRTDKAGRYRAPLLPVGSYEVSAGADGFATTRRKDLTLTIGATLTADLALRVAAAEQIVVTAEAPVIETQRSQEASTVNERSIAALPVNGRNFIDFVLTTPGVTRDVRQGDISFAGQRGTLNSLVVDGADDNNTFFGQALGRTGSGRAPYQFSQDAVQEFQVNRNAYSAEYGRAGGAVINVVTKSGTNDFHGSLFEFYRDKSLNSNSYANELANQPKSPYHYNQFGGTVGGPVVRDRAFFFLSYDGQRNTTPNDVNLDLNLAGITLPTDADTVAGLAKLRAKAGSFERGLNQDVFFGKADWDINTGERLTVRYNDQQFTGQNFENGGATNSIEHTGDSLVSTRTANAALASVFGSDLFNELRAQYAKDGEPGKANSNLPEATIRQNGRTILVLGRNFFSPRGTTIDRNQIADGLTWVRGNSTWKAGFDYNHDKILNFFPGNFGGAYTFNSIADFNRGIPNVAGERYVQAFAGPGTTGPTTRPDITEYAAFLQDSWEVRSNLTVNLGLRYDLQDFAQPKVRNPDPQLAAAGIDTSHLKIDRNNLAPRLGVAWSPVPETVVRAGYGIFYGRTPAIMVGTAHSNNGINVQTVTFTGNQVPAYPNVFPTLPTGAALPKPTIFIFDKNFENPEVQQASLGVERALSANASVAVSYLHVEGRKLQRSRDLNLSSPVLTQVPVQGGGTVAVERFPTARPFTNFDRIIQFESTAKSKYDGLTIEARKRFAGTFQARLARRHGGRAEQRRRRQVRLQPLRLRGRPRPRGQRCPAPAGGERRLGSRLLAGRHGLPEAPPGRLVARLDRRLPERAALLEERDQRSQQRRQYAERHRPGEPELGAAAEQLHPRSADRQADPAARFQPRPDRRSLQPDQPEQHQHRPHGVLQLRRGEERPRPAEQLRLAHGGDRQPDRPARGTVRLLTRPLPHPERRQGLRLLPFGERRGHAVDGLPPGALAGPLLGVDELGREPHGGELGG
jgi:outer membrane receptor protein involved in Fe transport